MRVRAKSPTVPADDYLDPQTALFVGGFVAVLFWFAAGLAFVAAGDVLPVVRAFALGFVALGALFLLAGVALAAALHRSA
jgi:hypothetical protein